MQQDRLNLKQWRNREDGLGQDRKRKNMRPKLPMITVGVTTLAAAEFEHHRRSFLWRQREAETRLLQPPGPV